MASETFTSGELLTVGYLRSFLEKNQLPDTSVIIVDGNDHEQTSVFSIKFGYYDDSEGVFVEEYEDIPEEYLLGGECLPAVCLTGW